MKTQVPHPQFALGWRTNEVTRDNPLEIFLVPKNNCENLFLFLRDMKTLFLFEISTFPNLRGCGT